MQSIQLVVEMHTERIQTTQKARNKNEIHE